MIYELEKRFMHTRCHFKDEMNHVAVFNRTSVKYLSQSDQKCVNPLVPNASLKLISLVVPLQWFANSIIIYALVQARSQLPMPEE